MTLHFKTLYSSRKKGISIARIFLSGKNSSIKNTYPDTWYYIVHDRGHFTVQSAERKAWSSQQTAYTYQRAPFIATKEKLETLAASVPEFRAQPVKILKK